MPGRLWPPSETASTAIANAIRYDGYGQTPGSLLALRDVLSKTTQRVE